MSYFEQILGGNIPLSVIESVEGFQNEARMATRFPHVQIKRGKQHRTYPGVISILASDYANHVNMSMALKREDIVRGITSLLTGATNEALTRNRNDIIKVGDMDSAKLSDADKATMKKVVGQVTADLSKALLKSVEELNFAKENRDILINIMHLTGLTNKPIKELVDITKKLGLLLELHPSFTPDIMINITDSLKNKLNPTAIKRCKDKLVFDCLFEAEFIHSLADNVVDVLDNILGNMMNTTKHGKICKFYALSIEISRALSISAAPKLEKFIGRFSEEPQVEEPQVEYFSGTGFGFIDKYSHLYGAMALEREDFAVNIGNTKNIKNKKSMQDIAETEKKLDQSKVIEGAASFVTKAANKAASSNKADLTKALSASNRLNISNMKSSSGGFTLTGIKQKVSIQDQTDGNFVQKIANKITTDISNNLKDEVKSTTKQLTEDITKKKVDEKSGTNAGDVISSLGGAAAGAVKDVVTAGADVLSVGIGNSTDETKIEENMKSVKEKFSLDQSFKVKKNQSVSNDFANALSSDNLAKCASEAAAANNLDVNKVDVKGDIVISNIEQEALIGSVMKCAFNQEVTNEIATKIVNSYDSLIQEMIENVDKKLTDEQIAKVQGDIYAAGVAGAAVLQAGGEAVGTAAKGLGEGISTAGKGLGEGISTAGKGLGEGIGTAGKGLGEGIGTAGKGLGEGIGSAMSGMTGPLIAAAVLAVVGGAFYFFVIKKKKLPIQEGGKDLLFLINELSDTPVFKQ